MSWSKNKDWMLAQEKAGKATAAHKAWLDKWRAAGSPSSAAGMSAKPKPTPAKPSASQANAAAEAKRKADAAAKAASDKKAAQMAAARKAASDKKAADIKRQQDQAKRLAAKKAADAAAAKAAAAKAAAAKAAAKPPVKQPPITGKDSLVGGDGLTNAERYAKRQADKRAKAEAREAKNAAIDLDRPEGVSRYLWEKVKNGDTNYNKTLVTRNPETRDAIVAAGHGDYVKDIHEQAMEEAANHYVGNGANTNDAFNTAQTDWYTNNVGVYTPEAAAAKAEAAKVKEQETKPPMPPAEPTKGQPSGGGIGAFFNGIRNGSATNIKGNAPAGGTDASVTVDQTSGNPSGMFNNLMNVLNDVRDPNNEEPIKFTQAEIDAEVATRAEEQAAADAAAQAAADAAAGQAQAELFNPTQEAGPVRNRNFQTVDYTQGGSTAGVNTGIGVASQSQATPWADAYMRAQQSSAKQGPISGLFSKEMENS